MLAYRITKASKVNMILLDTIYVVWNMDGHWLLHIKQCLVLGCPRQSVQVKSIPNHLYTLIHPLVILTFPLLSDCLWLGLVTLKKVIVNYVMVQQRTHTICVHITVYVSVRIAKHFELWLCNVISPLVSVLVLLAYNSIFRGDPKELLGAHLFFPCSSHLHRRGYSHDLNYLIYALWDYTHGGYDLQNCSKQSSWAIFHNPNCSPPRTSIWKSFQFVSRETQSVVTTESCSCEDHSDWLIMSTSAGWKQRERSLIASLLSIDWVLLLLIIIMLCGTWASGTNSGTAELRTVSCCAAQGNKDMTTSSDNHQKDYS